MDRTVFFAELRRLFGQIKAESMQSLASLLDLLEADPLLSADPRFAAYFLATCRLETGETYRPVHELGSDDYFIKRYYLNGKVRNQLGNRSAADAVKFAGVGFIQLTGRSNYQRFSQVAGVDLIAKPERASEPEIAYRIASVGMTKGMFTGRKLSDYFTDVVSDWVNARRVVNGLNCAEEVAIDGQRFLTCSLPFKEPTNRTLAS